MARTPASCEINIGSFRVKGLNWQDLQSPDPDTVSRAESLLGIPPVIEGRQGGPRGTRRVSLEGAAARESRQADTEATDLQLRNIIGSHPPTSQFH